MHCALLSYVCMCVRISLQRVDVSFFRVYVRAVLYITRRRPIYGSSAIAENLGA